MIQLRRGRSDERGRKTTYPVVSMQEDRLDLGLCIIARLEYAIWSQLSLDLTLYLPSFLLPLTPSIPHPRKDQRGGTEYSHVKE
jgi:hypothetical protein